MKRVTDIILSFPFLIFLSPLLLLFAILVFFQDNHSPFYFARRVGKNGKIFHMIKLRSMIVGADKMGIDTAAINDKRITRLGHVIRRYKIDELFQLVNVLKGDMSLVGPRPNVEAETKIYTKQEQKLLLVRPGITDFSSIVFSDLAEIVRDSSDTNIAYNQLVRPWKSRLGIFYVENNCFLVDLKIIVLTMISLFSRLLALKGVAAVLRGLNAPKDLIEIALRDKVLVPSCPPGSNKIVDSR